MNVALWLVESGRQFPISISALVIRLVAVGLGGISVDGIGVAEVALHPTKNNIRTTVVFTNGCDNIK